MRILIVEDDLRLREQLAERLRAEGYAVDLAANGTDGEFLGKEYPIDVAIVDLGLPDRSGGDVIKHWRSAGIGFPVLILTARGRWEDKVAGLELGADDFLVKPFHTEELIARLKALVRRSAGWSDPKLRCDPVVLDTAARVALVNNAEISLTALEYKVLEYLMLHTGAVVSKSALTEHIYEDESDRDSNVLEVIIGRLRRKLDPDKSVDPIDTVRGQGYRFRLPRSDNLQETAARS
ncbi:MAG: response regulator transcription factor [Gammaproteobacteria bacterium]|nr:response regulator transcription factor [Gammaproteobacteria bacterium]